MTKLLQAVAVFFATFLGAIISALSAFAIGSTLAQRNPGDYYAAAFLCLVCPSFAALMGLLCGCLIGIKVAKAIPKEIEERKRDFEKGSPDVDDTANSELEYECDCCHTKQKFDLRDFGTTIPCKTCGASIDVGASEWSDHR